MRATSADRPGDEQQDDEHAKGENSEGPGRNRQFALHLSLQKRQSQGHTRSVAVQSGWWVLRSCVQLLPDLARAGHHVLGRGHLRETHRATGVQLLRGDSDLGTEPELTSVDEPT